jgi:oligopeptide/dipeptide ABC transporter ATP-binding protein
MSVHSVRSDDSTVLQVKDLVVHFHTLQGVVLAVNGVSLEIEHGRTLGVVGESGCGKSVTALSILGLIADPPGKIIGGEILFRDSMAEQAIDLRQLSPRGAQMRSIRGNKIAMIFQEPMTSLTPAYTIGEQIMEAITLHQQVDKREARERAIQMLERVGMPQPSRTIDSYPHQFSGGMLQRAMIAIGLSCNPSLLIADEPTTALDVTTEAQILELMRDIQQEMGMAIMYITHDLGVIAEMAEQVVVMYLGKVVERADVKALFYDPQHPYTRALLKSIPRVDQKSMGRLEVIRGMVPDPYAMPDGCPFHPRCRSFMPGTCDRQAPELVTVGPAHQVMCHLYG